MKKGRSFGGIYTRKQEQHYKRLKTNNPMLGKQHTEETKELMRAACALVDQKEARRKAWLKRDRTYILVSPTGQRHKTTRMHSYCTKHGLSTRHLSRIAKYWAGDILAGSRYWRGWDCYKVNHKNRRGKVGKPYED